MINSNHPTRKLWTYRIKQKIIFLLKATHAGCAKFGTVSVRNNTTCSIFCLFYIFQSWNPPNISNFSATTTTTTMKPVYRFVNISVGQTFGNDYECYHCEGCHDVKMSTPKCRTRMGCIKIILGNQSVVNEQSFYSQSIPTFFFDFGLFDPFRFSAMTMRYCLEKQMQGMDIEVYCKILFRNESAIACLTCMENRCNGNNLKTIDELGILRSTTVTFRPIGNITTAGMKMTKSSSRSLAINQQIILYLSVICKIVFKLL